MIAPRRLALLLAWVVLPGWLVAQTTTFTWTGNAATISPDYASGDASLGGNWVNGVAPISDDFGLLQFGPSAGVSNNGFVSIRFPYSFAALGLTFSGPRPRYEIYSDDGGTLRLGEGTLGSSLNFDGYNYNFPTLQIGSKIELLASQTWTINDGYVYALDRISQASAGLALTKAGNGALVLYNSTSSFSGGLNLQSGTLYIGASSGVGDLNLITGPVGSGTLTLGDNTVLRTNTSDDVTLHNPISLGNAVTIGNSNERNSITLAGAITPLNPNTTLRVDTDGALFIQGPIVNAASDATSITFTNRYTEGEQLALVSTSMNDNFPVVVLSGTNTYTGATTADHAGVIFLTPGSLGQTIAIAASSGYVGTGYSGGMEAILGKIAVTTAFDGALGFDTPPELASPTVFADNVNLASFAPDNVPNDPTSGFWGLGSMTSATITGTITPPDGGNYVFGGGSGKLYVQSNLGVPTNSTAAGVRVRTLYGDDPLTVWLQGANTFTGNLMSDHSIVVLDSATALPNGSGFSLDSGAYVGYTENFTAGGTGTANVVTHTVTPDEFISRLANNSHSSDSIFGFDSANPAGRTITDPINLGSFEDVFIGTSTHVHLQGAITAPLASKLSVTGVNGGWLAIDSPLVTNSVNSLNIGATSSDLHRRGYVELTSGDSTFAGGTTLNSGYLLLGASSTVDGSGTITKGPLGTGHLEIEGLNWNNPPTLVASAANVTLHNNITFTPYSTLHLGAPVTSDTTDDAYPLQAYTGNALTLAGALSGNQAHLSVRGNTVVTLAGDNSGLTNGSIQIGGNSTAEGAPRVIANTNTALGATSNYIALMSGADLQFTTAAPVIGSIYGGYKSDTNPNASFIALAADSNLTINETITGYLYANIGGAPADFSGATTAAVNASLTKNGNGSLVLFGNNTYSGGTTVNAGMVIAGSASALGTGTVTLNGGGVGATSGITFSNPIAFGANGGTLGGSGVFDTHFTIGTNIKLAPGNSPGVLTFTNGLTLDAGGTLSIDIVSLFGTAGVDYDHVKVTGGVFAVTGADASFTIQINSLTSAQGSIGALSTDFSTAASLTLIDTTTTLALTDLAKFSLNTTNFTTYQPGEFSLSLSADSTDLILNFTPVPEPSTYALMGLGLLVIGGSVWRNRRSRQN